MMSLSCIDNDSKMGTPDWLLRGLSAPDLVAIGTAYRRDVPAEQSAATLRAAVERAVDDAARWPWSARPSVEALVAAEFAAGDTVIADGWVLARTEARLCALLVATSTATSTATSAG